MILNDKGQGHGLSEFGIDIPVKDSRAFRTFEHLAGHPRLGPKISSWHRRPSEDRLEIEDFYRVHSPTYVDRLFSNHLEDELIRTFELIDSEGNYYRYSPGTAAKPLSSLFERILSKISGTWQCCRLALENGFCFYFGGGMHHAQWDYGNGFCVMNDIIIAIRRLQADGQIRHAWVIDTDVHKGDGTAALTKDDPTITTLSIHMASGWPLDQPSHDNEGRSNPSFTPSDIDIPIESGEERFYIDRLDTGLAELTGYPDPDIAVVVYGADPYFHDELPSTRKLQLTLKQLMERDLLVYRFLKQRNVPMAYLMAGGYGERAWEVYSQFLEFVLLEKYG